jgi:hypothetical protein
LRVASLAKLGSGSGDMSADPNALLAFKQLNLKERVRVHPSCSHRRKCKNVFPPPTHAGVVRSCLPDRV